MPPPIPRATLGQLRIRNLRSIGSCRAELAPLTVLIGRNGSGKSTFLDAPRFVADALRTSLEHAIRERGGIESMRRFSTGHPRNIAVGLGLDLPNGDVASFELEIRTLPAGAFAVKSERLLLQRARGDLVARYRVDDGEVREASFERPPPAAADRLYLLQAAGVPELLPVHDALAAVRVYDPAPAAMRGVRRADAGHLLDEDGTNLAGVVGRLAREHPVALEQVKTRLAQIAPGIVDFERLELGSYETLEFRRKVAGAAHPWRFTAAEMSDGTLRALAILVAAAQLPHLARPLTALGLEAPEASLHPAAQAVLVEALREASRTARVVMTTHSPDVLDRLDHARDGMLLAELVDGTTWIAPFDAGSLEAIRRHLQTPGELFRMDRLLPDRRDLERQLEFFDDE